MSLQRGNSGGSGGGTSNGLTDAQLRASPLPVAIPNDNALTNTQLRASPVPVSISGDAALTNTQLRATPVPVSISGDAALTNTQLRASAVPVTVSNPGLTDAQLRASAIPVTVSNQSQVQGLTDTQLRASPIAVSTSGGTVQWIEYTSTALGANAFYTGAAIDLGSTNREIRFFAEANTAGKMHVSFSINNSTWRRAITADTSSTGVGQSAMIRVFPAARYVRVEYQNGSTAQSGFLLAAAIVG